MPSNPAIITAIVTITIALLWHFGSGIATGVPLNELLLWDAFQESFNLVQRTKKLISLGIWGFLMMSAAGLTVFLVAYMVYARWREKRMWSDISSRM